VIHLLASGVRINLVLSNLLLPEVDGFALFLHVKRIIAHSVRIRYGYPRCSDGGRGQAVT